jgi:hypothetical protein
LLPACRKPAPDSRGERPTHVGAPTDPSREPPPLDRLAPGEIAQGTDSIYGLVLPRGMTPVAHFGKKAHAIGPLAPEAVANYVRDRVTASRVELGAVGTIFPAVRVKGGDPERVLRVEVLPVRDRTKLILEDITRSKARLEKEPNLTDAERWRRAGYNPDGTPLEPLKLQ